MNDRALRNIVISLSRVPLVFHIKQVLILLLHQKLWLFFCLAKNLENLTQRLKKIVVTYRYDKIPVTAADLNVEKVQ
ncbi:hypothetical protein Q648_01255 [Bartonella quintana JK 12]|uniref:Uncharacterized protein n=1 Tax=Bartonella quintana JK 68 TaxID=1134503 RepID=A0ABR4SNP5_BARQI|nr:hypothetical protein Q651_00516 [Bartonella quintana BQ2-D70]ETS17093.1 hypothetical protein Q648_01255 [Bartonella quintana JK 12]ETS19388.1 hypothetical protein Q647_00398 [Bartonella quintana JK 7]KEC61880.1 hypothetical protein O91_00498 [Bartonella quintana JK 31]KEC63277.1 hypothetical protein O7Y_00417 [Bartonella quintana JK 63]KEC65196.1 hypothetical protein O7U_00846 [Bartonella quintana JK 68]KEC65432.1 hypothetical protein O7W_00209 [Bartonella quintana JK 56]KEC65891.1 hypoth